MHITCGLFSVLRVSKTDLIWPELLIKGLFTNSQLDCKVAGRLA